ncbi:DUF1036 domain-containing protein [Persicobacter diffluens]|uniref:Uncharacterized protein n=1 Tax=Persicobacter diffluens TaxID=981 RepID=A0AAN5AQK6_9BACT|nr:hypothetical protein PEDI_55000 [Persicobacter diffluens]
MKSRLSKLVKNTIMGALTYLTTSGNVNGVTSNENLEEDKLFDSEGEILSLTPNFNLKPKLLLRQNSMGEFDFKMHRSHRSHQSHRSHYSSNSGHASHFSHYSSSTTTTPSTTYPSTSTYSNGNGGSTFTKPPVKKTHDRIKFKNLCGETIHVLLRYKDISTGLWTTKGWWKVAPDETAYVVNVNNSNLYFYAESNSYKWEGQDNFKSFEGETYGMREVSVNGDSLGDCIFKITCEK